MVHHRMPASSRPGARTGSIVAGLATGLFALAATATPAVADDAVFTVGTVGAAPGQTVRVPVHLQVDGLVGAIDLTSSSDGLTVTDVDYDGPIFFAGWGGWDSAPAVDPFINAACVFPEDQVSGDLPLFDMLVSVPATAEPGTSFAIDFPERAVWNYDGVQYDVSVNVGGIVVTSGGCDEDLDGDGAIGLGDLVALLADWGSCDRCVADLDADGVVAIEDLVRVLAAWGPCS